MWQNRLKRSLRLLQQINNLLRHLSKGHCPHRNGKHQETLSGQKSRCSKKRSTTYPIPEETGGYSGLLHLSTFKQRQRTSRLCSIAPIKRPLLLESQERHAPIKLTYCTYIKRKIKLSSMTWLTSILHNRVNIHFNIKPLQNLNQQISKG